MYRFSVAIVAVFYMTTSHTIALADVAERQGEYCIEVGGEFDGSICTFSNESDANSFLTNGHPRAAVDEKSLSFSIGFFVGKIVNDIRCFAMSCTENFTPESGPDLTKKDGIGSNSLP